MGGARPKSAPSPMGFYAGPAPNQTPATPGRRILADELSLPWTFEGHQCVHRPLGEDVWGVTNRMGRTQNGVIGALIGGAPAQFVRFCVVGGAGYVTNLVTFAPLVHYAHTPTLIAACIAYACGWVVALIGHRHWTFAQRDV